MINEFKMQTLKTFHDSCIDNINHIKQNDMLYELRNSLYWIADIILEYNKLGFLTFTSQPGVAYKNIIYKSAYHRLYGDKKEDNIFYENGVRQQRAYIRGYMHRVMAKYIVTNLLDDEFLFTRAENLNNIVANFEIPLGSVNFYKNIPMVDKIHSKSSNDDLKCIVDGDASFSFDAPLHRPYRITKREEIVDIDNIVEFDILDVRWNNNDYLWKKLLELMQKYFAKQLNPNPI